MRVGSARMVTLKPFCDAGTHVVAVRREDAAKSEKGPRRRHARRRGARALGEESDRAEIARTPEC